MDSTQTKNVFNIQNREIEQDEKEKQPEDILVESDQLEKCEKGQSSFSYSSRFKASKMLEEDFSRSASPEDNDEVKQRCNRKIVRPPSSKVLGDLSYSDIIAMAIESSEQKKMTLGQIYDWISHNIPYFRNKSQRSSQNAGWKNAIRHTLSIRKRFIRLSNSSGGRSSYNSWWAINPGRLRTRYSRDPDIQPTKQDVTRVSRVSRGTQTEEQNSVYVPQGVCCCGCENIRMVMCSLPSNETHY